MYAQQESKKQKYSFEWRQLEGSGWRKETQLTSDEKTASTKERNYRMINALYNLYVHVTTFKLCNSITYPNVSNL